MIFYADDRFVASPKSARLKGVFDALAGLFDRVGLRTNKGKTVIMAFRPCHTPQAWSMESYTLRVGGYGTLFWGAAAPEVTLPRV